MCVILILSMLASDISFAVDNIYTSTLAPSLRTKPIESPAKDDKGKPLLMVGAFWKCVIPLLRKTHMPDRMIAFLGGIEEVIFSWAFMDGFIYLMEAIYGPGPEWVRIATRFYWVFGSAYIFKLAHQEAKTGFKFIEGRITPVALEEGDIKSIFRYGFLIRFLYAITSSYLPFSGFLISRLAAETSALSLASIVHGAFNAVSKKDEALLMIGFDASANKSPAPIRISRGELNETITAILRKNNRPLVIIDFDEPELPYAPAISVSEIRTLMRYVENGGEIAFLTDMSKEWFYNRVLSRLCSQLNALQRSDILTDIHLILSHGNEIFAYETGNAAYRRIFFSEDTANKEDMTKEKGMAEILKYLETNLSKSAKFDKVKRGPEVIWSFGGELIKHIKKSDSVKVVAGEPVSGAPGFVWAGFADSEREWDVNKIYLVPLVRGSSGRHEAPLPVGCNAFTLFWTGGEDAKSGKAPGHWEHMNYNINYYEAPRRISYPGRIDPGALLPLEEIDAQAFDAVFDLPYHEGQGTDPIAPRAIKEAKQMVREKIFYDDLKYSTDSTYVSASQGFITQAPHDTTVKLTVIHNSNLADSACLILRDSEKKAGAMLQFSPKTDIPKSIMLALSVFKKKYNIDKTNLSAEIILGSDTETAHRIAAELCYSVEAAGISILKTNILPMRSGGAALVVDSGRIMDVKMPPVPREFSPHDGLPDAWEHEKIEGHEYGEFIPRKDCPEDFIPIIEHVIRTDKNGFMQQTFKNIFGVDLEKEDIENVRIEYLGSGGMKYAFLLKVAIVGGRQFEFSVRTSYPWMSEDDRLNMLNSIGRWRKFGSEASEHVSKFGCETALYFKDDYMIYDVTIISQEYVRGHTLRDIIMDQSLSEKAKIRMTRRAVSAYLKAHEEHGIAIWEPKAANICLVHGTEDKWKIIDLDKLVSGTEYQQKAIRTREEYIEILKSFYGRYPMFNGDLAEESYPEELAPDDQIGKQARIVKKTLSLNKDGSDGVVEVMDPMTKSRLAELNLKRSEINPVSRLKEAVSRMRFRNEAHRLMLEAFTALIEKKAPALYTFNENIRDLRGFYSKENDFIALHENLADDPVALFHELAHLFIDKGKINIIKRTGNNILQVRWYDTLDKVFRPLGAGKILLEESTFNFIRREKKSGAWPRIYWQRNPHYALRVLQRQIFGERDTMLTQKIRDSVIRERNITSKITAEKESLYGRVLKDSFDKYKERYADAPVIIALGTSWIKGYSLYKSAMFPMLKAVRELCAKNGIIFICGKDESLLPEIEAQKFRLPEAKIIVLADKKTVEGRDFMSLKDAFLAGVDNSNLREKSYVRLPEMLALALNLGLGLDVYEKSPNIYTEDKGSFYLFMPNAEPIDWDNTDIGKIYEAQMRA